MAQPQPRREPPVDLPVAEGLSPRERAVINITALLLQHCRDAALDLQDLREVVNHLTRPRLSLDEMLHPGDTVVQAFESPPPSTND